VGRAPTVRAATGVRSFPTTPETGKASHARAPPMEPLPAAVSWRGAFMPAGTSASLPRRRTRRRRPPPHRRRRHAARTLT